MAFPATRTSTFVPLFLLFVGLAHNKILTREMKISVTRKICLCNNSHLRSKIEIKFIKHKGNISFHHLTSPNLPPARRIKHIKQPFSGNKTGSPIRDLLSMPLLVKKNTSNRYGADTISITKLELAEICDPLDLFAS